MKSEDSAPDRNGRQRRKGKPMRFEDLTPEQQEKAKTCKTAEDVLALAKAEGYDLSDEELEGISGGWDCDWWGVGYTKSCTDF